MQACVDPVLQVTQLSCLFLNGLTSGSCRFSLGLSLILEEVAGGSGCLRPLLASRPQRWGTRAPHFFFISKSCTCCIQNQSTFEKWLHVHPPGPVKPHSKGLFTRQQHQSPAASPWLGLTCPPAPPIICSFFLVLGGSQVVFPQASPGWRQEWGCGIPKHKRCSRG